MSKDYPLIRVKPGDVEFMDFNPRGENEPEIQNDPSFEQLKESVYKYGVLVPIVVHEQAGKGKRYKLVDGERRLRAALATNRDKIPAHVTASGDELDDLVQAFHIHMLRKQWQRVAQTRALKRLMARLRKAGRPPKEEELLGELQEQTGCTETQLKDLRRGMRFPERELDAVNRGDLLWSHLVQIEASFMEQVEQVFPDLLHDIGKKHARAVLVEKAKRKVLSGTRALLLNVAPVINRARQAGAAEKATARAIIHDFLTTPDMSAEEVSKEYEKAFPSSGEDVVKAGAAIIEASENLTAALAAINPHRVGDFPAMAKDLRSSLNQLRTAVSRVLKLMGSSG